jgi:prevent-host-death family protein
MPRTVAVSELKAHCLGLVEQVARERREIVITKRGKPIARLVPLDAMPEDDPVASLRGTLVGGERVEDFDTGLSWNANRR